MRIPRNHIDLTTLVCVLLLMVLGVGVVYSASSTWAMEKFGASDRLLESHATKVFAGFVAIFIFMNINYHIYRRITKPVLFATVVVLALTLFFGGEVKGATRWFLGLQPSEFAKYALVFHLCVLITEKKEKVRDFKTGFMPMMIWIGLVTGLVLLQPNFSTGVMLFLISVLILFVGRARLIHMALAGAALVPALGLYMVDAPYRLRRVTDFWNTLTGHVDVGATGVRPNYQVWQGIIGFGNGGIFGVGPGESRQRDLFLPESYGDFVFSIAGEEYGLIGTLFIMLLFLTVMLRGLKIAKHARDDLGRYLAIGIVSTVTLFALVNAAVTLGLLPTTGLPMPFVSYGGSSILFTSMAIGVLLNISSYTDLHPRFVNVPQEGFSPVAAVGSVYS